MTHADAEALVLLALDETVPADVASHVGTCPECRAELAAFERTVEYTRSAMTTVLVQPSPRVWAAIHNALAASAPDLAGEAELAAHARLLPVGPAAFAAAGEAEIGTDDEGRRVLQVTLHADLPARGLRQAWLVNRDDPDRRQTLGILDGTSGLWSVDRSIDLHQYAVVEITQQDIGSTQHSGEIVVRGELLIAA